MKVLITGSNGFLGKGVYQALAAHHDAVRGTRSQNRKSFVIGDLSRKDYAAPSLDQFDVVIHLAAKAHVFGGGSSDADAFNCVNIESSLKLARSAAESGVKRFIYLSSIGVNGINSNEAPFTEDMPPAPHDPYSMSKYKAEEGLRAISKETGLEIVIIRPPLIYGPSAPGNFASLIKLVNRPIPLPFASVNNRRSFVFLRNIAAFIVECVNHPAASNQTFVISDGQDVSLRTLVSLMRSGMGQSPKLIPVPVWLFKLAGKLSGKSAVVDRLVGNLQVDPSKAADMLGWTPPYTFEEAIRETVKDFKERNK